MKLLFIILPLAFNSLRVMGAGTVLQEYKSAVEELKQTRHEVLAYDPLRVFYGKVVDLGPLARGAYRDMYPTNDVRHFLELVSGEVVSSNSDGILLKGVDFSGAPKGMAFLKDLPYPRVDGTLVYCWALPVGVYRYTTAIGGSATVPCFYYGKTPSVQQKTEFLASQEEARQKISDNKKQIAENQKEISKLTADINQANQDAPLLKFQTEQANAGLPSFQYDLGLRYLTGKGVAKDEATGIEWLKKAAAGGNDQAKKKLMEIGQ